MPPMDGFGSTVTTPAIAGGTAADRRSRSPSTARSQHRPGAWYCSGQTIERLIADAAAEPGILPLLQETMVQLWDARSEQTLTLY
jgi:hypothetical protein